MYINGVSWLSKTSGFYFQNLFHRGGGQQTAVFDHHPLRVLRRVDPHPQEHIQQQIE